MNSLSLSRTVESLITCLHISISFLQLSYNYIFAVKVSSNKKKKTLMYKQMEIFHKSFQYSPSNLSDFIEFILLVQSV